MSLSPYQELFFKQELSLGTPANNILCGVAQFSESVNTAKLDEAIQKVIRESCWAFMHIEPRTAEWVKKDLMSGAYFVNKETPLSISAHGCLWNIVLDTEKTKPELRVSFHHAMADAHSFQLFWKSLYSCYFDLPQEPQNFISTVQKFDSVEIIPVKKTPSVGIGPIERLRVLIPNARKTEAENNCREKGIQLSTALLGCLQEMLVHTESSIQMNLQTGIALRNRSNKESKNTFTSSVNFLPVANHSLQDLKPLERLIKLLFRHQNYPLLNWLEDNNSSSAFNVLFSFQKEAYYNYENATSFAKLRFLPTSVDENIIGFHVLDFGNGDLELNIDFRTDIADIYYWRNWTAQYIKLVHFFLKSKPTSVIFPPAFLKQSHKESISLFSFFDNAPDDKVALVVDGVNMTYRALKESISTKIFSGHNLLRLHHDRTIDGIVSILAAWKSGIPVSFTASELNYIPPGDFLYLAETSGSTGKPKQIFIRKDGIESLLPAWRSRLNISESSVHLSLADQRFDVFFGDLLRSLFLGGTMVLATEQERLSPASITRLIEKYKVTHLESTPSFLSLLSSNSNSLSSLRCLICGSEPVKHELFEKLKNISSPDLIIYNSYGLTEVSIDSAIHKMTKYGTEFPVGMPVGDQAFTIRNENKEVVTWGVWGELFITGSCVGNPVYNEGNFILEEEGVYTYATGDRAMLHPVYGLSVKGRVLDDFIKVHGKRIPSREIEEQISKQFKIQQVHLIEKNGFAILLHDSDVFDDSMMAFLKTKFAKHQLPDFIQSEKNWPLNQNGKIDKKQLRDQVNLHHKRSVAWLPDQKEMEKDLHELLIKSGKEFGDKQSDLMLFGWNSIDLLSFCNEWALMGYNISVQHLLAKPTIEEILRFSAPHSASNPISNHNFSPDETELDDILSILNQQVENE